MFDEGEINRGCADGTAQVIGAFWLDFGGLEGDRTGDKQGTIQIMRESDDESTLQNSKKGHHSLGITWNLKSCGCIKFSIWGYDSATDRCRESCGDFKDAGDYYPMTTKKSRLKSAKSRGGVDIRYQWDCRGDVGRDHSGVVADVELFVQGLRSCTAKGVYQTPKGHSAVLDTLFPGSVSRRVGLMALMTGDFCRATAVGNTVPLF